MSMSWYTVESQALRARNGSDASSKGFAGSGSGVASVGGFSTDVVFRKQLKNLDGCADLCKCMFPFVVFYAIYN